MYFEIGAAQSQGARNYQEDTYQVFFPDLSQEKKQSALVILADGMGGHAGGAVASKLVVDNIASYFEREKDEGEPLHERLKASTDIANQAVLDHVREHPELQGMGCTLVIGFFSENSVQWLSVGDSHLYLLRNGEVVHQNDDHSYGAYIDKLEAEGETVPETPNFTPRRNMLMSYINGEEIAMVDVRKRPFPLLPGDRLIIASDGLDSAKTDDFPYIAKANETAQEFADALMAAVEAAEKKNQDNTTVVVIDVYAEEGEMLPVTEDDDTTQVPHEEDEDDDTLQPGQESGEPGDEVLEDEDEEILDGDDMEDIAEEVEELADQTLEDIAADEILGLQDDEEVIDDLADAPMPEQQLRESSVDTGPAAPATGAVEHGADDGAKRGSGKGLWIGIAVAALALAGLLVLWLIGGEKPIEPGLSADPSVREPSIEPPATPVAGGEAPEPEATKASPAREPEFEVRIIQDTLRSGGTGPEMVILPAGTFMMGSNTLSVNFDERPAREVRVAAFAISRYETTFEEYDRFVQATGAKRPGDQGWGRGRRPVINVSRDDARSYANWLSSLTGQKYQLPSEAQWEYAARAGTTGIYWWGGKIGNHNASCWSCGSSWDKIQTAEVGSFSPNPWGLYDTAGNVLEWTADCYHKNYEGAPVDTRPWSERDCASYVARGGSFSNPPDFLRSAKRLAYPADTRQDNLGFRLIRRLE